MAGRPQKTTVDFFPHFVHHKKTIKIVRQFHGNDGYAVMFLLLELLGRTDGHHFNFTNKTEWFYLVSEFGVEEDKAKAILELLVELEFIDAELFQHGVLWCQNFVDNLFAIYQKRGRKPPSPPITGTENRISGTENTHSIVEDSIEENTNGVSGSKGESEGEVEVKRFIPPKKEEMEAYFISKGFSADMAGACYDHHKTRGWILKGGQKMKCWKSACSTWIRISKENQWGNKGGYREQGQQLRGQHAEELLRKGYGGTDCEHGEGVEHPVSQISR